jgi:ADP-ribose pyrophosphatase YjhB (NUDIX family)
MRPLAFPTPESLAAFLRPRIPAQALASWGAAPGTKTLLNLFLELSHGDCALHAEAPASRPRVVRAVRVAAVHVRNRRGARLVEVRQLLSDGRLRSRGPRPLAEKMRPGESPEAAAARAVREELGALAAVRVLGAAADARVEERDSASYPGLPARYVLHAVRAEVVGGVPEDGAFETEEAGEDAEADAGAVTVKRHFWEWVHDDEDDCVAAARAL